MDQALLLNLIAPALTAHEAESAGAAAPTVAVRARWWSRIHSRITGHPQGRSSLPA